MTHWTVNVDAKVHEVYPPEADPPMADGEKKQRAAKSYNEIYSLQPMYGFVHETDELIHCDLRSGNTHHASWGKEQRVFAVVEAENPSYCEECTSSK